MSTQRYFITLVPGLILAIAVAVTARFVHGQLPHDVGTAVGEVIVAVLLGLTIGNATRLPAVTVPGIRFSFHTILRTAIVLLGATFSFAQVVAIGGKALLMVVALMLLALAVAHALGRLAGAPPRLATLIGVGTAVCGNSAIVGTAPVIGAHDDEVSFAIATNTLFGTLAVFLYPFIGHALHLNDSSFGTWAGTAVNDTSQVVATGFAYSEAAGKVATAVKLTRNALMGGVIVAMGFVYARAVAAERGHAAGGWMKRLKQSFPLFVILFLALALANTWGLVKALSDATGQDFPKFCQTAARFLILVALAGVGLSTRFDAMRKTGLKPFYVGLATAAATATASLLLIHWFGPAA